jgi:hypothetical protein
VGPTHSRPVPSAQCPDWGARPSQEGGQEKHTRDAEIELGPSPILGECPWAQPCMGQCERDARRRRRKIGCNLRLWSCSGWDPHMNKGLTQPAAGAGESMMKRIACSKSVHKHIPSNIRNHTPSNNGGPQPANFSMPAEVPLAIMQQVCALLLSGCPSSPNIQWNECRCCGLLYLRSCEGTRRGPAAGAEKSMLTDALSIFGSCILPVVCCMYSQHSQADPLYKPAPVSPPMGAIPLDAPIFSTRTVRRGTSRKAGARPPQIFRPQGSGL